MSRTVRVTMITTLRHNVGDDFVREGILYLLDSLLPEMQVQCIHKHIPLTARPGWDWYYHRGWARRLDRLPKPLGLAISRRIDRWLPLNPRTDKILSCDLLVQCGAPVYWLHPGNSCATVEWFEPLIQRRWSMVAERVPLLNLAIGTCQRYHSDGSEFAADPRTLEHIRSFFDKCRLTTLRDHLSQRVLALVDRKAEVLPCTSIFARHRFGLKPRPPTYVALNYMPTGGHYQFGQAIDPARWEKIFVSFAREFARRERCVLVCHNAREREAAERLLPEIERFYSEDHAELLEFYAEARYGIMNRVHGAFAIASYGRPAIVIGTDSRARMAEVIGLRNYFVEDVNPELLAEETQRLADEAAEYAAQFERLATDSEQAYRRLLGEALAEWTGQAGS